MSRSEEKIVVGVRYTKAMTEMARMGSKERYTPSYTTRFD